jgi:hypothetical protein
MSHCTAILKRLDAKSDFFIDEERIGTASLRYSMKPGNSRKAHRA